MKTAHVFLETAPYEEVGNVLSQAAAASCAIVTTDVGMAETIVVNGQSGFLCAPGDYLAFSKAMHRLLGDPAFRESIRLNGMMAIERYFNEKMQGDAHYRLHVLSWRLAIETYKTMSR
jgi:glycosyltransferase involved in cell wall biosynthesis